MRSVPKMTESNPLEIFVWARAPANPPATLAIPNRRSTVRSTWRRSIQNLCAVARKCDIAFPGMIFGRTIRSSIPCGKVKSIKLDFDTTGFTIVDHRDIPARNIVDLIEQDQPFLVETEVRHNAEPILLLGHEDREKLNA